MTLSNRIPEFLTQNDNSGELKFGPSLCESDECPNLDRCEYYNASHSDCSEWATKELNSACGGSHNCIETDWNSYMSEIVHLLSV